MRLVPARLPSLPAVLPIPAHPNGGRGDSRHAFRRRAADSCPVLSLARDSSGDMTRSSGKIEIPRTESLSFDQCQ